MREFMGLAMSQTVTLAPASKLDEPLARECGEPDMRERCGDSCSRLPRSRDEPSWLLQREAMAMRDTNRATAMETSLESSSRARGSQNDDSPNQ